MEKAKRETEIDVESVCLCVYVYACAPCPSPIGGSNLRSPSDFTKLSFRAHSCLAEAQSYYTTHSKLTIHAWLRGQRDASLTVKRINGG